MAEHYNSSDANHDSMFPGTAVRTYEEGSLFAKFVQDYIGKMHKNSYSADEKSDSPEIFLHINFFHSRIDVPKGNYDDQQKPLPLYCHVQSDPENPILLHENIRCKKSSRDLLFDVLDTIQALPTNAVSLLQHHFPKLINKCIVLPTVQEMKDIEFPAHVTSAYCFSMHSPYECKSKDVYAKLHEIAQQLHELLQSEREKPGIYASRNTPWTLQVITRRFSAEKLFMTSLRQYLRAGFPSVSVDHRTKQNYTMIASWEIEYSPQYGFSRDWFEAIEKSLAEMEHIHIRVFSPINAGNMVRIELQQKNAPESPEFLD